MRECPIIALELLRAHITSSIGQFDTLPSPYLLLPVHINYFVSRYLQLLSPFCLLQVSFVGEGAIDCGGPRREFFRLVALEAKGRFFIGGLKKFFLCDMMAIQVNYLIHFRKL